MKLFGKCQVKLCHEGEVARPFSQRKSVTGQSVLSLQEMAAINQFLNADGQAVDTSEDI